MPLFRKEYLNTSTVLAIWKVEESTDLLLSQLFLDEQDLKLYSTLKLQRRQQHWLSVRVMVKEILGKQAKIYYDEHRKPSLPEENLNITITHSGEYSGIILSNIPEIGIDIEIIQPRIERLYPKFLNETEINSLPLDNRIEPLHIYWCAKESLFKIYGKHPLGFKKNLLIEPFIYEEKGRTKGNISLPEFNKTFWINYEKFNNYMLVFVGEKVN